MWDMTEFTSASFTVAESGIKPRQLTPEAYQIHIVIYIISANFYKYKLL